MDLMINPQVTKIIQTADGTLVDLELNGQNVELGSEVKLDNNKTASIDVSTYTSPVTVSPSTGKAGMKKTTITLTNNKLFAFGDASKAIYLRTVPAEDAQSVDVYVASATGLAKTTGSYATESGVTVSGTAYARYEDGDIAF